MINSTRNRPDDEAGVAASCRDSFRHVTQIRERGSFVRHAEECWDRGLSLVSTATECDGSRNIRRVSHMIAARVPSLGRGDLWTVGEARRSSAGATGEGWGGVFVSSLMGSGQPPTTPYIAGHLSGRS